MMKTTERKGLVICVSGPSGVGKGTVIAELIKIKPDLLHSISVTTRLPRAGEREGIDYYFKTPAEFRRMLAVGEILEHDYYCGNYYGTPKQSLLDATERGKSVVMDITVPGSLAVMKSFEEVITLFLLPPSFSELKRRLTARGTEDEIKVEGRLRKAEEEMTKAELFEYVIVNHDVEQTVQKISAIIEAEQCRYKRVAGIEKYILMK